MCASDDLGGGSYGCRQVAASIPQENHYNQKYHLDAISQARMRGRTGDLHGEELAARRLLSAAESAGDQQSIVESLEVLGHSLGWQGRFVEAEAALVRCLGVATATAHVSAASRSLSLLTALDTCQGHLVSAHKRWAQAHACSSSPDPDIRDCGAFLSLLAGDLATVRGHVAQPQFTDLEVPAVQQGWLRALAAMASAEMGHITEARRLLERSMPRADQSDSLGLSAPLYWWAASVVAWARGQPVIATVELRRAVCSYSAMEASALVNLALADLAEFAVAAGDPETAAQAAAQANETAHRTGAPMHHTLERFATAGALLGGGRTDAAARLAGQAVDEFEAGGYALLAGRAQLVHGTALQHRDRSAAVDALRGAAASFDRCGAFLRGDQARKLLARLESDSGCASGATPGQEPLTAREHQVAALAAHGYTARQIADRLHIGTRTVETHLRRIYPKLGITCKQELVARTADFRLSTDP